MLERIWDVKVLFLFNVGTASLSGAAVSIHSEKSMISEATFYFHPPGTEQKRGHPIL